jgi:Ca-activated chloride channel family protein
LKINIYYKERFRLRSKIHNHYFVKVFLIIAILSVSLASITVYSASPPAGQKIDVVLVVDVSKSMEDNDPNSNAYEAMNQFIDNMYMSGDQVGVVPYSIGVKETEVVPLTLINGQDDKIAIKSKISKLTRGGRTDIAEGVNRAVKMLEDGQNTANSPLIVLIADGYNDLVGSGKSIDSSNSMLNAAIKRAQDKKIPIYTIGLKLGPPGDTEKEISLPSISEQTGGFFESVNQAEQIPTLIQNIFAKHRGVTFIETGPIDGKVKIDIPNENVKEANITIIHKDPSKLKPTLTDNKNKRVQIPSSNVIVSKSKTYMHIKILKPAKGLWVLEVPNIRDDEIKVNLIYNYDLTLTMDPIEPKKLPQNAKVKVQGWFEENGQKLTDDASYSGIKANLIIVDEKTKVETKQPIDSGKGFTGIWQADKLGKYSLKIVAEDDGATFIRETTPVEVSVVPQKTPPPPPLCPPDCPPDPWWKKYLFVGMGLLVLIAGLIFWKIRSKTGGPIPGVIVYEIRDEDDGSRTPPQTRRLAGYAGNTSLHQLLGKAQEFVETDKVIFQNGERDAVVMRNLSECTIEKMGRPVDAKKGITMKQNEKFTIRLKSINKSITIEWRLRP